MRSAVVLAALMAGGVWVMPCSASVIGNGSFEETTGLVLAGSNVSGFWEGSVGYADVATLPEWTIAGSSYSNDWTGRYPSLGWFMSSGYTPAEDGAYLINLTNQGAQSAISQSFAVTSGMKYTVSYWEKYRTLNATLDASVAAADGILMLLESTGTGAATSGSGTATLTQTTGVVDSWTNYTFTFTASAPTTVTLIFENTGSALNTNGTYLDMVSVSSVPEPAAMILFVMGVPGLACCWRRRRWIVPQGVESQAGHAVANRRATP